MIRSKPTRFLTRAEFNACYNTNYGAGGTMRATLVREQYEQDTRAIMVWENGELLGWGLLFRYGDETTLYVYVRHAHRKAGIGTAIVRHSQRFEKGAVQCAPSTPAGFALFRKDQRFALAVAMHS